MKINWLYIFIPIIIQGIYDYAFWYGVFKEKSGHRLEWLYRVLKETTDLIIIPYFLVTLFNWNIELLTAFYLAKWGGLCDAVYILIWKAFHPGLDYTENNIWWMWWTPLGMIRSQIIYSADLSTFEPYEIMRLFGKWFLLKGKLTFKEFYAQLIVMATISNIAYTFGLMTKLIWLINFIIHKLILFLY